MGLSEKLFYVGFAPPSWSLPDWLRHGDVGALRLAAVEGLATQWHYAWPDSARLTADFERLLQEQQAPAAFQACAWQKAVSRPYVRARRYRLLTLHDGARVVGVLPLWLNTVNVLESVGSMVSDYLEPLVSSRHSGSIWAACLRALDRLPGTRVAGLVLHNLRKDCVDFDLLASTAAATGYQMTTEEAAVISRVPLPADWDEYLAGLASHDRKEIRRKLRNAESRAGAHLAVARSADDVPAALEKTLAFMQQGGWAKGMKVRRTYRPLFDCATEELVRGGKLEIYLLRLEDRDAAGIICFPSPVGPMLWGAGFDAAARGWSPGIVLFAMAIRRAISERARYFDLMRGEARYKSNLGAVDSPIYRVILKRNGS